MFEEETRQPIPQAARTTRGYDRCEKCKAQHVKCDGTRPVCRRCHGKGYACIYVPKRSPWIVYAATNRTSRGTTDLSLAARPPIQSVDRLSSSDISVDVHALMHYFFPIDAGYTPSNYLNEITSSLDLTVSYASLPALYQSIVKRKFETDPAVLSIRGNVLQSINKALRKSSSQIDDYTIISIKHQLYYDCFISSKSTILAHLDGLYQIIRIRGGLNTLGLDGDLAHMLKLHSLMAYIITERLPPREYLLYKTRCSNPVEAIEPVSLAYCPLMILPGGDRPIIHVTTVEDPRAMLEQLICCLQQLTDTFLHPKHESLSSDRQKSLYLHILNSPIPCLSSSSDSSGMTWIYESCRLAGIIFAAAIRYGVPISRAAPIAAQDVDDKFLLENLCRAIYRSPYSSRPFWGELGGCFLWVSLVSASLSQCGVDVELPQDDDLYWSAKARRASLVVAFSYATKLFHARASSDQAFLITEIMIRIQEKLAISAMQKDAEDLGTPLVPITSDAGNTTSHV